MNYAAVVLREKDVARIAAAREDLRVDQPLRVPLADAFDRVLIFLRVQADLNAALRIWSAAPKVYTPIISGSLSLFGGALKIPYVSILTVVVCLVIMVALTAFTSMSKMGKAMRACSEDRGAAQLMGINVNATISMTFAIGSALAAIAGVLLCSYSPVLQPTTGSMPGIKAFTAAVFGGIGSIPGAFLGGLLLGVIEAMAQAYISTQLSNTILFAVLIVVLLVKPSGLLGKYVPEKV